MKIEFTKMHGLGNDYIYVNTMKYPLTNPEEKSIAWSRPHTGIGSDGLVLIGDSDKADFSMRIFNADGSEAKMCGNASRCIGKYLYEYGLTTKTDILLDTLSGIKELRYQGTAFAGEGRKSRVCSGGYGNPCRYSLGGFGRCLSLPERSGRVNGKPSSGYFCR